MSAQPAIPVPPAVEQLAYRLLPESTLQAMVDLTDAKCELGRVRLPLSVEDEGDRESVLAVCAVADKTLCSVPCRITAATGSLS